MTKRTIEFITKTYKGLKGKKVTVNIDTPFYKLRQTRLKTELGYFDITVSLDRRGRLNAVMIERTKYDRY